MRIVIGGASGLIGKRLCTALRGRGDDVFELVRKPPPEAESARQLVWDGRSPGPWSAAIDGADAVIHLSGANVGAHRWTDAYKKEILESRVQSTHALVEAMRTAKKPPRSFVCASAVGFYGSRDDEPLDERAAPGKDFLADVCVAWEAEARLAESLTIRTAEMRTGVVLAPQGEKSALDQLVVPFKLFVGGHVGNGKQWFPWIHIDDEIAAFLFVLDHHSLSGPVNLAAPGIVNMRDFSHALGAVLGRPSWAPVPDVALKVALGEFAEVLLGGQRVVPAKLREAGFEFKHPDLTPALKNLLRV